MESAESPLFIPFHFLGLDNAINALTVSWFVSLLLIVLLAIACRNMKLVPSGLQNFFEMVVDFVQDMAEPQVGKHTAFFFPLFFYLFIFIFFSNLMGLIPGSMSPTSRVDVNVGMALIVFLSTHYFGIKQKGLRKYLSHYLPPPISVDPKSALWLKAMIRTISLGLLIMMPAIHLVGELVKPVSLTLRLFGNMMGKEKILGVSILLVTILWNMSPAAKVFALLPFILRVLIVVLGVFVSFMQGFVFMFLSMVYIGGAIQEHEEHPEGEPAHD
ncbi:MAG TPA: F0F1 ATP synthase subunit A [bacterium]|jgi:F-type H+-transporting ATPase subunit a|nr:F0F1 ATP synthase subunit A [bacterium]